MRSAVGWLAAAVIIAPPLVGQQPDGKAIYREECKLCHGIIGVPPRREQKKYKDLKPLSATGFVGRLTVDSIVTILRNGINDDMKSFKEKLGDAEIRAVAVYIKELAAKRQ